jgi:hypothetical protein
MLRAYSFHPELIDVLELGQFPHLADVAGAREDAKGKVCIEVNVTAFNVQGLDEGMLELSVRELLLQYGLDAGWIEE